MAKISVKQLVEKANSHIRTWSVEEALSAQSNEKAVLVDIRDVRELGREGKVDGAIHAPRGMLEFWFDEESPYHRDVFANASKDYVLFCAMGWRSALATKTLKDMGFENVAHIDGGFKALRENGANIIVPEPTPEK